MRRSLLVLLLASAALAQPRDGGAGYAGLGVSSLPPGTLERFAAPPLPPELSRRVQALLDVRSPGAGRLTDDGRALLFGWNVTGVQQVWRLDGPQRFPVQLTGGEDATTVAGVAPDGSWHVVSRDVGGAENPGLFWQPAQGGPLRAIHAVKDTQSFLDFISDDGRWVYFHANDRKPDAYTLYRWEKASGKTEVVLDAPGLWSVADHRPDGRLLLRKERGSAVNEVHELDPATGALTPLLGVGEQEEYAVAYGAAPGEVLVRTPKLGEHRRLYSLKGGALSPVTPELGWDVAAFAVDLRRQRLLYTVNEGGYSRLRALDARTYRPLALPRLPDADQVTFGAFTRDGRRVLLVVDPGTAPPTPFVLDWQTGQVTPWQLPSAPEVELKDFVRATVESYPARDGTRIPMVVRRPARCAGVLCPVVVQFHGGPEGQAVPGFSVRAQLYVDAGFILVEPNVRGSDGYGKAWFHADDGPRRLDVITDIEDAARHVRQAFAVGGQAPRVAIVGGSYGGYSTLMGMTRFAGAYDAGVSVVGFSNLLTFLKNTAPYRRALRINEYGDPERDREALSQLSPLTHIEKVKAPLLLIQGANDPRVPVGEALQMHEALERRGLKSPLILFGDEGHGAQKRGNQVATLGHTLRFLKEHLQGAD